MFHNYNENSDMSTIDRILITYWDLFLMKDTQKTTAQTYFHD